MIIEKNLIVLNQEDETPGEAAPETEPVAPETETGTGEEEEETDSEGETLEGGEGETPEEM